MYLIIMDGMGWDGMDEWIERTARIIKICKQKKKTAPRVEWGGLCRDLRYDRGTVLYCAV